MSERSVACALVRQMALLRGFCAWHLNWCAHEPTASVTIVTTPELGVVSPLGASIAWSRMVADEPTIVAAASKDLGRAALTGCNEGRTVGSRIGHAHFIGG